jgi:hypothetical protein
VEVLRYQQKKTASILGKFFCRNKVNIVEALATTERERKKIDGDMQTSHQAPSLHCARREQQYTSEAPRLELFISVISLHRFMVISPFYSPMSQNVVEKWESLSDNISSSSCVYRQAERKKFFYQHSRRAHFAHSLSLRSHSHWINSEAYHYANTAS